MTGIPISELRTNLAEVVGRVAYGGKRVLVSKSGKPACAIVPMSDIEALVEMEKRENRLDVAEAEKALAKGEFLDWEDLKAELEL